MPTPKSLQAYNGLYDDIQAAAGVMDVDQGDNY